MLTVPKQLLISFMKSNHNTPLVTLISSAILFSDQCLMFAAIVAFFHEMILLFCLLRAFYYFLVISYIYSTVDFTVPHLLGQPIWNKFLALQVHVYYLIVWEQGAFSWMEFALRLIYIVFWTHTTCVCLLTLHFNLHFTLRTTGLIWFST